MASMLKRVGSSSGSSQHDFCKEELQSKPSKVYVREPGTPSVHYVMVEYADLPVSQSADYVSVGVEKAIGKEGNLMQGAHQEDPEDDFSGVAEEFCKVEAHSKLSTAVQRGFRGNVQNSVKKLGDSIAKVCQQGEAEDGAVSSGDGDSLFTAAYSLRKKLSSSKIHVDSSEYAASAVTARDDVMSEYSASHDVDSIYSSPSSSKLASHSMSTQNLLDSGKVLCPDRKDSRGELSNWHGVDVSHGHADGNGEGGVAEWVANEAAALGLDSVTVGTTASVNEQTARASVSGSRTSVRQEWQAIRTSMGELVPLSYMDGIQAWEADGPATATHMSGGKLALGDRTSIAKDQETTTGDQKRKLVVRALENLTPDQQLLLRVEELEMKVNFLLAARQSQLVPNGYVVLALPTVDLLRLQAARSVHQMKTRLIQGMSSIWALRPLVPVINKVEEIVLAVFCRLPVVGVTEKHRL